MSSWSTVGGPYKRIGTVGAAFVHIRGRSAYFETNTSHTHTTRAPGRRPLLGGPPRSTSNLSASEADPTRASGGTARSQPRYPAWSADLDSVEPDSHSAGTNPGVVEISPSLARLRSTSSHLSPTWVDTGVDVVGIGLNSDEPDATVSEPDATWSTPTKPVVEISPDLTETSPELLRATLHLERPLRTLASEVKLPIDSQSPEVSKHGVSSRNPKAPDPYLRRLRFSDVLKLSNRVQPVSVEATPDSADSSPS